MEAVKGIIRAEGIDTGADRAMSYRTGRWRHPRSCQGILQLVEDQALVDEVVDDVGHRRADGDGDSH